MAEIIPPNQVILIDPDGADIFSFNNKDSNVYLGTTLNKLLDIFGNDVIIHGLDIKSSSIDNNNIVRVVINPGKILIDKIIIDLRSETEIQFDTTNYNHANGKLILVFNYRFHMFGYRNVLRMRLIYLQNSGMTQEFDSVFDRFVKAVFTFDNTQNKNITYVKNGSVFINNETLTINKMNNLFSDITQNSCINLI